MIVLFLVKLFRSLLVVVVSCETISLVIGCDRVACETISFLVGGSCFL